MSRFGKDLSEGSVSKQLISFSVPFLISNLVQSLYSVADMLIVGNFSGTAAVSGVNIGSQITHVLTMLVLGFCTGGTIMVSQYMGARDEDGVKETISTLITALLVGGLAITVIMFILIDPSLRLLETPAESYGEAKDYLTITILGILFIFAYNAFSAILRGMGDSKRPFYFVSISCVTNIVLDLVLVAGMGMGAKGAAIATVFSQAVSVVLCIIYLRSRDFVFDFRISSFKINKAYLAKVLKIGAPSAIQSGVTSISFMFITTLVNITGGVNASAAVGIVGKFNSFAIMPASAMSASVSTMCAQNIGADKWDRAIKTCKIGTSIAWVIGVCIFTVAQLFPGQILAMFDRNPDMIAYGIQYMRSFSFDYILVPFVFCVTSLFTGAGHTSFAMLSNMISALFLRIPAAYIFSTVFGLGVFGIGLGAPTASLGSVVIVLIYLASGRWRVNKVIKRD
ncbi:MAG: MATE family efflux transporter [Oscillospiraceae bacterium]|nr:MATE family efflux transporter [Oscillospiraceae bacterium]